MIDFVFPVELKTDTLLIPAYDLIAAGSAKGKKLKQIKRVNSLVREHNGEQRKILEKYYPYPWKLVSLWEVSIYRQKGHYYFLDHAVMPRHWPVPNPYAMAPTYRRYKSTNEIYRITDFQFHYYFYIRDLQTDKAFMTDPPHGQADVYAGITWLLKKVTRKLDKSRPGRDLPSRGN